MKEAFNQISGNKYVSNISDLYKFLTVLMNIRIYKRGEEESTAADFEGDEVKMTE